MSRWRACWFVALVALLATVPAAAQAPPIAFEDPLPSAVLWPKPVRATVLNNTTETLAATIQVTDLTNSVTGTTVSASDVLQPIPPAVTIPPAGSASLTFMINESHPLPDGELVGSLVLSVPAHNTVIRKQISLSAPVPPCQAVPPPAVGLAITNWTLNAIRIFPFVRPVCLRGPLIGCTLPLEKGRLASEEPYTVGHLVNEAGGAIAVTFTGVDEAGDARLLLDFDRPWGYVGAYKGTVDLRGGEAAGGDVTGSNLTVYVKDAVIWPLLVLLLSILMARQAQHHVTIRQRALQMLARLNSAEFDFAKLRKSVHGYTVAEDFQKTRDDLEARIRLWDRTHYGLPTERERRQLRAKILDPLGALEDQLQIWGQFRSKLDRLGRRLLQDTRPAIREAQRPADVDLDEPRFYTAARLLLRGIKLQMSQVPDYARRVDDAAELAGKWGELERLAGLVRDAVRELSHPNVDLSESEHEMLEAARHHLNSAARDLWEVPDLSDLRSRETEMELATAQDLTRQLLDPFVYYNGPESATPATRDAGESEPFVARVAREMDVMVRSYARLDTYQLPRLEFGTSRAAQNPQHDASREGTSRVGERTVTALSIGIALLVGLRWYLTSNFGTAADYLGLFSLGLGVKTGLEMANWALSRRP